MKMPSRPLVVAAVAAVLLAAGVAVWLQATAGGALPPGFLQFTTVAVGTSAFGAFVIWHRPGNRYGAVHLAIGILFSGVVLAAAVLSRAAAQGAWPGLAEQVALAWSWLATAPLLPLWVMAIATFPDGRFHRRTVRVATVALAVVMPFLALTGYLLAPPGQSPPLIVVDMPAGLAGPLSPAGRVHPVYAAASAAAQLLGMLAPLAAVVALLHRYRTSGPVVRQQIKWLLAGAAVSVALQAIPVDTLEPDALRTAARALVVLAAPLPLIAAASAIVRHRLWDFDVVISKGLVYALVSGAMSALFLAAALLAGVTVGGRDVRVVAALGLGLLVSFLAQPLRRRLEKRVVRLLYGPEPSGLKALASLDHAAAGVEGGAAASRVADVAQTALGATWAGVWLYLPHDGAGAGSLTPVALTAANGGVSSVVPQPAAAAIADLPDAMLFTDLPTDVARTLEPLIAGAPAVVAPLTAAGALIGVIVCGDRERDPFTDDDLVLLGAIARQAALALRNAGLERELRQRLAQIERQAVQLHESRQRLVTAQDRERRRIERDLHDGVQQHLVALAARLRRQARGDAAAGEALQEIADQAEEAVFALQELARGIYPSLLVDQGLHAALQAHAARLPADVRVEVEPRMHGRRLHPDVEAALYFVALEAMTNAVKHAPGARILISLSSDGARHVVVLEVHDDGPGFEVGGRGPGAGLQNMADRVEAAGGILTVDSLPGGGTWVRAEVADIAIVSDISARKATP